MSISLQDHREKRKHDQLFHISVDSTLDHRARVYHFHGRLLAANWLPARTIWEQTYGSPEVRIFDMSDGQILITFDPFTQSEEDIEEAHGTTNGWTPSCAEHWRNSPTFGAEVDRAEITEEWLSRREMQWGAPWWFLEDAWARARAVLEGSAE